MNAFKYIGNPTVANLRAKLIINDITTYDKNNI